MREFLDRPYRDKKVRQQRKVKAVEYCKKLAKLKVRKVEPGVQAGSIFVPPELVEIAETSNAGVQPTNTEGTNSGTAHQK